MMRTGNIKADVEFLHHAFGELSVAEMDMHSSELHKKLRDQRLSAVKQMLPLPCSDGVTTFTVPTEMAIAVSSWLQNNYETNLAELPTKNYSPTVVMIIASSVTEPIKDAPQDNPDGPITLEFHLQVYLCATEMGMDVLQSFAFKFMRAALAREGLTVQQLKNLVEHHKIFTPDFCNKALSVPQYQKVMCAFATHIVAHREDFDGNPVYGTLMVTTEGYLPTYLNIIHSKVRSVIEEIKGFDDAETLEA
ncbi:hypothetical protein J4E83_009378 [Alternaria metachromatica]|uniref:uncharacterized protein n=1 Tax=Alternaria metachromatica TaxID=283354 RepID=UPI0020C2515A|nr:uncharacterized protein J4E83_009378 [Alternaria metachromatica]KAI4607835.1 hypothetical protein J4E83_009378 [Alternaria metachromatica]